MKQELSASILLKPLIPFVESRLNEMLMLAYEEGRKDERGSCIVRLETFAKEYAEKGVDETDQKAQAWAILQAAESLRA